MSNNLMLNLILANMFIGFGNLSTSLTLKIIYLIAGILFAIVSLRSK